MFIVIEGADGSGKTSLAEALKSQLNANGETCHKEFHKGRPEELTRRWALSEYATSIESYDFQSHNVIADRWHWGEVAYAPVKRPLTNVDGFGLLGVAGWRWVELFLSSRGAAQIWLHQPLDVISKRIAARGDDFVAVPELRAILAGYGQAAMSSLQSFQIRPDDDVNNIQSTADSLIEVASRLADDAKPLAGFPEYIGCPSPSVLLIADAQDSSVSTRLPFMPVDDSSGDFLMSALPESLWRSVGIISSGSVYGARLLELYDKLKCPKVVALGRMAEREVRASSLYANDYTVLPHPEYVRKFHSHDKFEYGQAIESFSLTNHSDRFKHWILQ
jgi:thymidylate kinase